MRGANGAVAVCSGAESGDDSDGGVDRAGMSIAAGFACGQEMGVGVGADQEHRQELSSGVEPFAEAETVAALALDETRREEFFRQGKEKRAFIKGKRWLFLTRWTNLSEEGRIRLEEAFRVNRRMFKAYFLKEDLSRLWEFTSPEAARRFFHNWVQNIRWQRIPAFWKLAQTLRAHLEGIVNFCKESLRFGVVEAINTTVKSVTRRGRGYRDHEYLKLKLMWITANPVIHT